MTAFNSPDTRMRPIQILFLCTGNSCRSQMAEGWANWLGQGRVVARSAGIEAHGQNTRAITVMREVGIEITHQHSKIVTDEMIAGADVVITVCGHADEHCAVLPNGVPKIHWPLPDPAKAKGDEDSILAEFRACRDDIRARVEAVLATWPGLPES